MSDLREIEEALRARGSLIFLYDVEKTSNNCKRNGIGLGYPYCPAHVIFYPDDGFDTLKPDEQAVIIESWYEKHCDKIFDISEMFTKDYVLGNVIPEIVSEKNREAFIDDGILFAETEWDIIVIFRVVLNDEDFDTASYIIHERNLDVVGVTIEEIEKAALENLRRNIDIFTLSEFLHIPPVNGVDLLVLTNKTRMYGAAAMLFNGVLEDISKRFDDDIVVLPSSIHEVLIVPITSIVAYDVLLNMVREVNLTEVSVEERLTDSIYIWKDGHLSVYNG